MPSSRRILDSLRRDAENRVRLPLATGNVREAALVAFRLADEATARAAASSQGPRLACAEGCSHCCHVHVEVSSPELVAMEHTVRQELDPAELTTLTRRLEVRATEVDSLSDDERWAARIPCALLDERGRCSFYAVRPLRCRASHSSSADVCKSAFEGGTEESQTNPTVTRAIGIVEAGYDRAVSGAGHASHGIRLERGLLDRLRER